MCAQAADGEAAVWHPDVRFFKLYKSGKLKAQFYLDPCEPGGVGF